MNEDEFTQKLEEYYKGYCDTNGIEEDEDTFDEFLLMANMRIEEMCEGGYESDDAIDEYFQNEILDDVTFIIKRD